MFKKRKTEVELLDRMIMREYTRLQDCEDPEQWAERHAELRSLIELRGDQYSIKPEVLVNAAAHMAGILLILQYERVHVVTSKALSFIPKLMRS